MEVAVAYPRDLDPGQQLPRSGSGRIDLLDRQGGPPRRNYGRPHRSPHSSATINLTCAPLGRSWELALGLSPPQALFSARAGRLVSAESRPSPAQIARHLSRSDPVLAKLIRRGGPTELPSRGSGFPILAQSILFQQISGAAGASILRRLRSAHGGPGFPTPEWFQRVSPEVLRTAGVSPQKMRYLRDLGQHVAEGRLNLRRLSRQPDSNVIEELTSVRGIGPWTAQMYLIFSLHRPDVFPSGDLGVRKAVGKAWGYRRLPAVRTVERHARRWAPFRSHAAYYLWRSLSPVSP